MWQQLLDTSNFLVMYNTTTSQLSTKVHLVQEAEPFFICLYVSIFSNVWMWDGKGPNI